ncbi:MAG: LamG domain-containing protein [Verrucomicrobia bacterium]|nr:LamG domain-containing protein [Verrucomicrobiota bacterium]
MSNNNKFTYFKRNMLHAIKWRILPLIIFTSTLSINTYAQPFLTNGLVAYYPLNGNAVDASGSGSDGVVYGAISGTDRFGITNGCFRFQGNGQYISAPASNLPTTNRTISLWFNVNRVDNKPGFLGYGGRFCGDSFYMGLNIGNSGEAYHVSGHCGLYDMTVPYVTPPTNTWNHWAVVTGTNGMMFYVNGQFIGSQAINPNTYVSGTQLGLGTIADPSGRVPWSDENTGFMDGYLDDVRIYNRTFSSVEIQQLYALESGPIESEPNIDIRKAVRLDFSALKIGANYQLQLSHDFINWTNWETPFNATSPNDSRYLDHGDWNTFWRLQVVP